MMLASSSTVFAATQSGSWEIWTGSLADFTVANSVAPGQDSAWALNLFTSPGSLRPAIGYLLGMHNLEVKLAPSYTLSKGGTPGSSSSADFRILGGVNYSFMGEGLENSFFVEFLAGINRESANAVTGLSASQFS